MRVFILFILFLVVSCGNDGSNDKAYDLLLPVSDSKSNFNIKGECFVIEDAVYFLDINFKETFDYKMKYLFLSNNKLKDEYYCSDKDCEHYHYHYHYEYDNDRLIKKNENNDKGLITHEYKYDYEKNEIIDNINFYDNNNFLVESKWHLYSFEKGILINENINDNIIIKHYYNGDERVDEYYVDNNLYNKKIYKNHNLLEDLNYDKKKFYYYKYNNKGYLSVYKMYENEISYEMINWEEIKAGDINYDYNDSSISWSQRWEYKQYKQPFKVTYRQVY